MTTSVIIATYNRAALLDECLAHLLRQRFLAGDEIIVVDNGSTDDTSAVVLGYQSRSPVALRFLHESEPGKSRAVARALSAAQGDVLAFTDDDVNVEDGWLEAIRDGLADPGVALVGGPVRPRWAQAVPRWIRLARERRPRLGAPIGLVDYGDAIAPLGARTLLGGNLAVRRSVFAGTGGFPTHLGKLRGTLLSGEDHELCRRVQDAGLRAVYLPSAGVLHWVPEGRTTVSYFLRWFYWSGITHAIMDENVPRARARALLGLPLYLWSRAARNTASALAALLVLDRPSALDAAVEVAFAAGYAAGRWGSRARAGRAAAPAAGGAA